MSADLAIGSPRTMRSEPATDWPHAWPEPGAAERASHLAPEARPRWRVLLEAHWRSRLERVTELSLAYHDAEEADTRTGHGAAAHDRQARPLLRQAVAERRALAEIEAALVRLANGRFGWCERCREPVPAVRLTRTPQARYCADCDR
jgi:RNA polymerase-binding transcription factor DksA